MASLDAFIGVHIRFCRCKKREEGDDEGKEVKGKEKGWQGGRRVERARGGGREKRISMVYAGEGERGKGEERRKNEEMVTRRQ